MQDAEGVEQVWKWAAGTCRPREECSGMYADMGVSALETT